MKLRIRLNKHRRQDPTENTCETECIETDSTADEPDPPTLEPLTPVQNEPSPPGPAPSAIPRAQPRQPIGGWIGAGLIGVLLAGGSGWLLRPSTPPAPGKQTPDEVATLAQSMTAPWAIAPTHPAPLPLLPTGSTQAPLPGGSRPAGSPSLALDVPQEVAVAEGLAQDPAGDEPANDRAPPEQTAPPASGRPAAKLANQTPAKAKSAKPGKRKAAKGNRKKTKSKAVKRARKSGQRGFWGSRQGGFFLTD